MAADTTTSLRRRLTIAGRLAVDAPRSRRATRVQILGAYRRAVLAAVVELPSAPPRANHDDRDARTGHYVRAARHLCATGQSEFVGGAAVINKKPFAGSRLRRARTVFP